MLENSIFLFESFPTGHALLFEPWVWINYSQHTTSVFNVK